jgi:formate/nitrite transporter FocA (FNT family)
MIALGILAGSFISMGAIFSSTVTAGATGHLPYGVIRLLGGLAFSLGLILVVVAGAELFTGNNLIIMAWAHGRVTTFQVMRNWLLVYIGNFFGAIGTAVLIYFSAQYNFGNGAVGINALNTAAAKC